MIFAREVSDSLTSLVKKIDEATQKNKPAQMRSFVVFLNDDEGLEKKLQDVAAKEGIKQTVLAIDSPQGPRGYNVAKEADVTVVLYVKKTVKANHAFKKGELKDADIEKIVKEVSLIVPKKD
jgi:hypothetical protein